MTKCKQIRQWSDLKAGMVRCAASALGTRKIQALYCQGHHLGVSQPIKLTHGRRNCWLEAGGRLALNMRAKRLKTVHHMKAGKMVILSVALVATGISVRAEDTPDQAAARAALEQKLYELDHPEAQTPSQANSAPAATQPAAPATNATIAAVAAPASTAPAETGFTTNLPAANPSAQAAALAAMEQKMDELNQLQAGSTSDTNATATPVAIPANEASAAATPVTESPSAEAPMAIAPTIASAKVAPVSAAPAVVAPAPKVSPAPPAATSVAAVPTASSLPVMASQAPPVAAFPPSAPGQVRPANELVTTSGITYKNVEVQKVTADAIVISYTPALGGWARTKIYFRDLPPEIRQQYEKP